MNIFLNNVFFFLFFSLLFRLMQIKAKINKYNKIQYASVYNLVSKNYDNFTAANYISYAAHFNQVNTRLSKNAETFLSNIAKILLHILEEVKNDRKKVTIMN